MPNVFFTSDTHFGDARTFALSKRPFADLAEMDATLVERWNATVGADDVVYHLGDVGHLAHDALAVPLAQLHGRIHLVLGNNDDRARIVATDRFETINELREIEIGGQVLFLCHYPLRDWPHKKRGGWHLFGHVHGRLNKDPLGLSYDVGTDMHGFAPVPYETIAQILTERDEAARAAAAAG